MATRYIFLMAHIVYILAVVVSSTAETTEHTLVGGLKSDSKSSVCQNNPSETNSKINAIDEAFGRSEVTDFVILIDRSESISSKAFENTKETITTLIEYLTRRRLLHLHEDYTRVAVVSFGIQSMVQFDGISGDSDPVHACSFPEKLARIELGTTGRNETNVKSALKAAKMTFDSSSRKGASKILWIFYDGEEEYTVTERATRELKAQDVTVFSVGVGRPGIGWMDTVKRENNVKFLAASIYHYGCSEDWISIIRNAMEKDGTNTGQNRLALYAADDTYTGGPCASCPHSQRCVCDVTNRQYTCAELTSSNTKLIIIITVTIATAMVIVIICIVICCFCRRHRKEPPEIAPRVVARKAVDGMSVCESFEKKSDDQSPYYNVSSLEQDETWMKQIAEITHVYVEPTQETEPAVVDKESEDDDYCEVHISWMDQPVTCETMTGDKADKTLTSSTSFKNDDNYEHILIGTAECRQRLAKMAEVEGVRGLLIYHTRKAQHWAATPGFLLPPAEMATFENVLGRGNQSMRTSVTAAGKEYTIDRTELSDEHFHATSENGDHLWVANQNVFIIVGLADRAGEKNCATAVFNLHRHLYTKSLQENVDVTSPIYEIPMYITPLPS